MYRAAGVAANGSLYSVNCAPERLSTSWLPYFLGLVLFLMPFFAPSSVLIPLVGFTLCYYLFVLAGLFVNKFAPSFAPSWTQFVARDEEAVTVFDRVVDDFIFAKEDGVLSGILVFVQDFVELAFVIMRGMPFALIRAGSIFSRSP